MQKDYSMMLDEKWLDAQFDRHFEESKAEHEAYALAASIGMSLDQADRYADVVKRIKAYERK